MNKTKKKVAGAFVLMVCLAAVIIGVFYAVTKDSESNSQLASEPTTEVGKLLEKDLDTKYPETPSEVVKLYWRFNKCMYNGEGVSDENFEELLKQLRKLYDDEFLADEKNSWDSMLESFKNDAADYQKRSQKISLYTVEPNSSTVYNKIDGEEYATVITNTMLKQKADRKKVYEKFMCRRDSDNNWKILGWEQIDSADVEGDVEN